MIQPDGYPKLLSAKKPLFLGTFFAESPNQPTNLAGACCPFSQMWPPGVIGYSRIKGKEFSLSNYALITFANAVGS